MKACRLRISLPLLLETIGLEDGDQLVAMHVEMDNNGQTIVLTLSGDHPDLPKVKPGESFPLAAIQCRNFDDGRIKSSLVVEKVGDS